MADTQHPETHTGTEGGRARSISEGIGSTGQTVKDGIIGSLRGLNEIEAEIVTLVRSTVANSLRATGDVSGQAVEITRDVMRGAISAAEDVGSGLSVSTMSVA